MNVMTEHESQAPRGKLYAVKGAAAPSPAVGHVSPWRRDGKPAAQPAGGGLASPLAALIIRRGGAKPAITGSARGLLDQSRGVPPLAAGSAAVIDPQRVLSTPGGHSAGRGASRRAVKRADPRERPNPNAPWAKLGQAPSAAPRPRLVSRAIPRKSLTVRLEMAQYVRVKRRAVRAGTTLQSILAAAVAAYLEGSA